MTNQLIKNGLPTLSALSHLSTDAPVLLALSGGADSVALLHLLAERKKTDGFALTLAHVNHGIRGEEALRDRDFCVSLAEKYGLEICVLDADVPAIAKESGRGLEEAARAVRYAYFEELMRARNIPILVTAHHADDHLETVLFRLSRGTGLRGLGGISPSHPFADGVVLRPLLPYTRREILEYCEENALPFVIDSTNADRSYARNRIRAEVIPVLESLFDGVQSHVLALSASAREDDAFLSSLASDFLQSQMKNGTLPIQELSALAPSIQKRVLIEWAEREGGTTPEAVHLQALTELLRSPRETARVALPNGRYVGVRAKRLCFCARRASAPQTDGCIPFTTGDTAFGEGDIRIYVQKETDGIKVHNLSTADCIILTVGFDIIEGDLFWRTRLPGETILLRGMHRKLRRLYAEAEIPPSLRERMPLLCDAEGVLWAPGVGARDGVQIVNEASARVKICVQIPKNDIFI